MSDAAAWARINDVFHRALEAPPDARAALVAREAGEDAALRDEVLSLLDAYSRADSFLSSPVLIPSVTAAASRIGEAIGPYRIEGVLGAGGMGVVFRARDTRLNRTVALKALAPEWTEDASWRERLRREARAAAALSHPGIATVYALEEFGDHLYIAGEYVAGDTLRDEIRRGPQSPTRVADTGARIAEALAAAHAQGIVHRDLKPENIIRRPDGGVKILDFGLARMTAIDGAEPLTGAGRVLGTPAYMSPEQIRGGAIDFRSDLFSLGVVLHELATGTNPFAGADAASSIARVLELEPDRIGAAAPASPSDDAATRALGSIVARCLAKSAHARFESTTALAGALHAAAAGRPSGSFAPAPPSSATASPRVWWQVHQGTAIAATLLLLIPLWHARATMAGRAGLMVFLFGLASAVASVALRWHLWFALREYPQEWDRQRARAAPSVAIADVAFAMALLISAWRAFPDHDALAVLFVASAVAIVVAGVVVEPATARAAARE